MKIQQFFIFYQRLKYLMQIQQVVYKFLTENLSNKFLGSKGKLFQIFISIELKEIFKK